MGRLTSNGEATPPDPEDEDGDGTTVAYQAPTTTVLPLIATEIPNVSSDNNGKGDPAQPL